MGETAALKAFRIADAGDAFRLPIEDDVGKMMSLMATRDQVDVILDSLDEILTRTEDADEVEDDAASDDDQDRAGRRCCSRRIADDGRPCP